MKPVIASPSLTSSLRDYIAFINQHLDADGHLSDATSRRSFASLAYKDWDAYRSVKAGEYTRHYLYQDTRIEVILIAWGALAQTKIHDHPRFGCLMRMLAGELKEERYSHELTPVSDKLLKENSLSYIDNSLGYHRIRNLKATPAFSLHIYNPPNHKIREWED